jgi:nitroreductase
MSIAERKEVKRLFKYPLLEAIARRRTRRFPVGCAVTLGSMQHKSNNPSVPLNDIETALLCWVGGGVTGAVAADLATTGMGSTFCTWLGRPFGNPCNSHTTKLFFTNDEGVFVYDPKEATKVVEIETEADWEKIMKYFEKDAQKIQNGRLIMAPEGVLSGQHWNINKPGTTVFMPIVNLTEEYINFLIGVFQGEGYQMYDDFNDRPAGIEKWINNGTLKGPRVLVSSFEYFLFSACIAPAILAVQNMQLVTEAMGLGSIPIGGYTSVIILGGTPISEGLAFDFVTGKNGKPSCTGKKGVYESLCPPYMSMDEAVDTFVAKKFGSCGLFTPECRQIMTFKDWDLSRPGYDRITDQTMEITKDYCNYIYDTFGRFPAFYDPIAMPLWLQAHHLEIEWYDKYQIKDLVSETHRHHMVLWHK